MPMNCHTKFLCLQFPDLLATFSKIQDGGSTLKLKDFCETRRFDRITQRWGLYPKTQDNEVGTWSPERFRS